jgi:hypothetical protein
MKGMEADDLLCSRSRGLRRMRRVAWPSSCSRNAHDQNVLVRRAQSRIDQATLENLVGIGKTRAVEDQSASIPREITGKLGGISNPLTA